LALLLADVAERIGRDGCIDVRQGGSGSPYADEYAERVGELDRLKEALKGATSDDERHRLERQIALLAGDICTFWINVTPSADYERQRRLIKESFRKLKDICAG
jgi:hypothetical protein